MLLKKGSCVSSVSDHNFCNLGEAGEEFWELQWGSDSFQEDNQCGRKWEAETIKIDDQ